MSQPKEARKQLLAKIVDRVFVWEQKVIAVALHGDFGVVLDGVEMPPSDLTMKLAKKKNAPSLVEGCVQYANDGI